MTTSNDGLVIVDKPGGMTSHDVVARIRRLAGTRKVGHAGTLDPMATGVLVVGVDKATRLLGHLTLTEKQYDATIRLGQATSTDDAEGEITSTAPARGVTAEVLARAVNRLTGEIQQVPPAVSAIKVEGQRAYRLARDGAAPELKPRPVTVYEFTITGIRPAENGDTTDVDATVRCSSGTYIRALARDLGQDLGTGGHLTRLRRTRVGGYGLGQARTLEQLAERFEVLPLAQAAAAAFPRRDLSADEARRLAHGARLTAEPQPPQTPQPPQPPQTARTTAAFAPDGSLVALLTEQDGQARPLAVFAGS
ncbi:MAG TPA: tRNA pseudouridine(55) synthase TruB [Streptosporangiaceae bacterium]|nr:tRNA pseudouridine(55) synthase TruB [Streptosporangiaceae bacterium]